MLKYLVFAIKNDIAKRIIQNVEYQDIDNCLDELNKSGITLFNGYSDKEALKIILNAFPVTKEMYGENNVSFIGYTVHHKPGNRNYMVQAI